MKIAFCVICFKKCVVCSVQLIWNKGEFICNDCENAPNATDCDSAICGF